MFIVLPAWVRVAVAAAVWAIAGVGLVVVCLLLPLAVRGIRTVLVPVVLVEFMRVLVVMVMLAFMVVVLAFMAVMLAFMAAVVLVAVAVGLQAPAAVPVMRCGCRPADVSCSCSQHTDRGRENGRQGIDFNGMAPCSCCCCC